MQILLSERAKSDGGTGVAIQVRIVPQSAKNVNALMVSALGWID